ncbi:MAG TPA: class I SAM-dependent methyltransferase [Vicinamibacterales bacterium]|nr:class I SAM-dependent methyltransferase [Vicinamibacterales bacterium]
MKTFRLHALAALTWFSLVTAAYGQATEAKPYEPEVGQDGKDVVWVPTSHALVEKMLDLAAVGPGDFVIDLGSGDGRTVIAAAKRGARALGVEFNPEMVALSKRKAAEAGVAGLATFRQEDLFDTDLSEATVITMFLLPQINLKLRPKLLQLRPGTRIVSNSFTMEEWEPDDRATLTDDDECSSWCTALLWIVPARVEGTWQTSRGTLSLKQRFQMVEGTLGKTPITNGRLRGNEITFTVGRARYKGHVNPSTIEGTITGGASGSWTATRTAAAD